MYVISDDRPAALERIGLQKRRKDCWLEETGRLEIKLHLQGSHTKDTPQPKALWLCVGGRVCKRAVPTVACSPGHVVRRNFCSARMSHRFGWWTSRFRTPLLTRPFWCRAQVSASVRPFSGMARRFWHSGALGARCFVRPTVKNPPPWANRARGCEGRPRFVPAVANALESCKHFDVDSLQSLRFSWRAPLNAGAKAATLEVVLW